MITQSLFCFFVFVFLHKMTSKRTSWTGKWFFWPLLKKFSLDFSFWVSMKVGDQKYQKKTIMVFVKNSYFPKVGTKQAKVCPKWSFYLFLKSCSVKFLYICHEVMPLRLLRSLFAFHVLFLEVFNCPAKFCPSLTKFFNRFRCLK